MSKKGILYLVAALAFIQFFAAGCMSTENAFGSNADVEKRGLSIPSQFFVIKKSDGEYINNITFKEYSSLLAEELQAGGWKPTSYGEADTFLLLEYGVDSFYEENVTIKPQYDQETNTTTWVHTGAEIKNKPYLRITGIHAADYRLERKETVIFTVLVTYPENEKADRELIVKMINVGSQVLL